MVYVNINHDPHPIIMPLHPKRDIFIATDFTGPGGTPLQEHDPLWVPVNNLAVCMNGYAWTTDGTMAFYRYVRPSPNGNAWRVDALVERVYPIADQRGQVSHWNAFGIALCVDKAGEHYYLLDVHDVHPANSEVPVTNVGLLSVAGSGRETLASIQLPYVAVGERLFSMTVGDNKLSALIANGVVLTAPAAALSGNTFSGLLVDGSSLCTPTVKKFSAIATAPS